MKKKILIISYSYPPANVPAAQRPYSFAKYLDKTKYEVTVLTCANQDSALGFNPSFNEKLPDVNLIKVKGIRISGNRATVTNNSTNTTSFKIKIKQLLFKILSYFVFPDKAVLWYPSAVSFLKKNKHTKYDTIISTSPAFTNHLLALYLKKQNPNSILITDFRDYHYLENHTNKKGIKAYLNKNLEANCIKKSDKICFISEAMKNEYANYYKKYASKFFTIYNGFDFDDYRNIEQVKPKNTKLSIFYAGSFYKGVRNPMPLLHILEELINQNSISVNEIQIEIAGNFENELLTEIKALKIFKAIRFFGLLPRNEVLKKYKESHLLWLIVGNKVSHYTGVPVKFYEYLASQRPIINFAPSNSEPTRIINELKLGWNFDPNMESLESQLVTFKSIIKVYKNDSLNNSVNSSNLQQYTRMNQTKSLEKLL